MTTEGMRPLDEAAGGGEVPLGPLGGPAAKTMTELLAEDEAKSDPGRKAERAAIDAAKAKLAGAKQGGTM